MLSVNCNKISASVPSCYKVAVYRVLLSFLFLIGRPITHMKPTFLSLLSARHRNKHQTMPYDDLSSCYCITMSWKYFSGKCLCLSSDNLEADCAHTHVGEDIFQAAFPPSWPWAQSGIISHLKTGELPRECEFSNLAHVLDTFENVTRICTAWAMVPIMTCKVPCRHCSAHLGENNFKVQWRHRAGMNEWRPPSVSDPYKYFCGIFWKILEHFENLLCRYSTYVY